jgi:hypothetical protein
VRKFIQRRSAIQHLAVHADSLFTMEGVMSKRPRNNFREDTIDNLLDVLSNMREEILSVERSLERIQAKPEQGKDGFGKDGSCKTRIAS